MDAQRKKKLADAGVNVDSALERFMGNEAMLEKYLKRFLTEKSYMALAEAVKNDDREGAATAAHTLKSVCGSIGCEGMFKLVVDQEAAMRAGDWDKAVAMMDDVTNTYNTICAALNA